MDKVLPLFKSHYSLGRSILSLSNEESLPDETDSVFSILKENKLKEFILVEDSISGFLEAYYNAKESKVKLIFGLRLTVCSDVKEKNEESLKTNNKIVIFVKNYNGYKKLIRISSFASKDGFYYEPRIDYKSLKAFWNNEDLLLAIPFYDSYIFKNNLKNSLCVPELDFADPVYFVESNSLPFDDLIEEKIKKISNNIQKVQSIFYRNKKDFKAYLAFKCISNRTTLEKPEFEHMCSDEFCVESWLAKNK